MLRKAIRKLLKSRKARNRERRTLLSENCKNDLTSASCRASASRKRDMLE
jgi:hypothetical protein